MTSACPTGKPVTLREIFGHNEFQRIRNARISGGPFLDEMTFAWSPACTYGAWLDALGLPDLAERARSELAARTRAGERQLSLIERWSSVGRRQREPVTVEASPQETLRWMGFDPDAVAKMMARVTAELAAASD